MTFTRDELDILARYCVGRRDDYALQQGDGRYLRVGGPLTYEALRLHLAGYHTIGSYLINERGLCRFAVFDADDDAGLLQLLDVQMRLADAGIFSYLEGSRRGVHLRVSLSSPVPARVLRAWLLPFCPPGVEFYPKQDELTEDRPFGSLVRLPLGVHRRAGRRFPFLVVDGGQLVPVARSLSDSLAWLSMVPRVTVPAHVASGITTQAAATTQRIMLSKKPLGDLSVSTLSTIAQWCREQDPYAVIGRYVDLDLRGMGCCPFGEHHSDGKDSHPSFRVQPLRAGSLNCWYCYVWQQGGDVFNFLCLWYGLSAREVWQRILTGARF